VLNVALLQMVSCGQDQTANLAKGEAFCRRARGMGADLAVFPEMWNVGYAACPADDAGRGQWQAQGIGADDVFVSHFRALARELEMAIALTYLERSDGAPRNTVALIDRHGEIVLTYAKVHTCDFSMEAACTPGDGFFVTALDTSDGEVMVGAMICYDREFPESARVLMLKGAEVIIVPNACTMEQHRLGQFAARAFENMTGVALANYASPQCNGHSAAFDGVAFAADESSREMRLVEAGEAEGVYLAVFDMEALRAYRRLETWGNAYRKPRAYGLLASEEVREPFARDDARR
jgi:predicted amidohydrolase